MDNFGQNLNMQKTSILKELSGGNAELGEAFAMVINDMVVQSGITNPKAESYEFVSKSWKNLAAKPDKTPEDFQKLDDMFKEEIHAHAQSYLLFMAKVTGNLTGKLDYYQYEKFLLKYRFGRYDVMNKPEYLTKVKTQIKNAFKKISAHGEASGDNLIDKADMAAYIYALTTNTSRNAAGEFNGFEINGTITPESYAVNENLLFRDEDNMFSIKLRLGYKMLSK